jgi:uncharacterized membrane protein
MNAKLKLAFLASILINVLLAGFLLGGLPRRFERGVSRQQQMEKALKELPEPEQARFREKLDRMRKDAGPIRDRMREEREKAIGILIKDPFDEAAYERQVTTINDLRDRMTQHMAISFKEAALDLPPERRTVVAEMLKRPPPR